MNNIRFSVFTATFNRIKFLPRVYESLVNQTFKDFEWIVIDDGSTDNTENLINSYIDEGKIKLITYVKKENGGKHTAWREATKLFTGKYVVTIDSDDILMPRALDVFDKYWAELENSKEFEDFWEVKARGQYEDGKLVGNPLPTAVFDTYAPLLTYKYKIQGDLHGCRKADVLRNEAKVPDKFIFEEYCSNFAESIRWFRAGRKYKTRYVEERTMCVSLAAHDRLSSNVNIQTLTKKTYNSLIYAIFALNENRTEMLRWSPLIYIKTITVILYASFRLKKNPFNLQGRNKKNIDVLFMILGSLPVYIFFKIRK